MTAQTFSNNSFICANKAFYLATALQNVQVLAAKETRGLTSTVTLDSAIYNYLAVSAKMKKKDLEKNKISYCAR